MKIQDRKLLLKWPQTKELKHGLYRRAHTQHGVRPSAFDDMNRI